MLVLRQVVAKALEENIFIGFPEMEQVSELSLFFLRPPIVAVSLNSKLQLKGKFQ